MKKIMLFGLLFAVFVLSAMSVSAYKNKMWYEKSDTYMNEGKVVGMLGTKWGYIVTVKKELPSHTGKTYRYAVKGWKVPYRKNDKVKVIFNAYDEVIRINKR